MSKWLPEATWQNWTPRELACWVAARCSPISGVTSWLWFDSAGNFPHHSQPQQSFFFFHPREIHRGNLHNHEDFSRLDRAQQRAESAGGGLAGWVDYEGDFCLAECYDALRYHHDTNHWEKLGQGVESLRNSPVSGISTPLELSEFHAQSSRETFLENVSRAKDWIASGDIYQVNLSQSFLANLNGEASLFPLYLALRDATPAPMSAWISLDSREILSSSPELFLRIEGARIETRPIKGTRPRGTTPELDDALAHELLTSEKERAELVMITDLLRNDIGQVCDFQSVEVEGLCELESLAQVHHLVSRVAGNLSQHITPLTALRACHPGGSITGAPKKRAREIIATLENRRRGLYCGSIGFQGFSLGSQWNIAIRTLVREQQTLRYEVGAGIVADSQPEAEYQETLHKAAGIEQALNAWRIAQEKLLTI